MASTAGLSHWSRRASSMRDAPASASPSAISSPRPREPPDRKSTRLNSSHLVISYAVFCLKNKTNRKSTRLNSSHLVISYAVFGLKNKTSINDKFSPHKLQPSYDQHTVIMTN